MKKVILTGLIVLLVVATKAQVNFGIKAGPNSYALTGAIENSTIPGGEEMSYIPATFHLGAFAQINLAKNFAIQPELLFSKEGNAYDVAQNSDPYVRQLTDLTYISIPVMLQYVANSGFNFEAGPALGFLSSAKFKAGSAAASDLKSYFKGSNLSFGAGLGYRLKMGLGFHFRYYFGVSNVSTEATQPRKTIGGQISVSYKFGGSTASKK